MEVEQLKKIVRQRSLVSIRGHGACAAFPKVTGKDIIPLLAALLPRSSRCQEGFPRRQSLSSFPWLCFPCSQCVFGLRVLPGARGASGIGVIPLEKRKTALEQTGHSHCCHCRLYKGNISTCWWNGHTFPLKNVLNCTTFTIFAEIPLKKSL